MGNKVIIKIECRNEQEADELKKQCDQKIKPVLSMLVASGSDIEVIRE